MIKQALINGIDIIANGWTVAKFNLNEEMNLLDNTIVFPDVSLEIHDFDNALSPLSPQSIFYGDDFSKYGISFYDDFGNLIYSGKIRDIKTLTDNKKLEFTLENSSMSIFEQNLQYVRDISDNYVPAKIVEDILVINGLKDLIYKNGSLVPSLARAIEKQEELQFYIGATVSLEDNITMGQALEKLAKISGAYFFYTDLQLQLSLWEELSQIRRASHTFTESDLHEMPVLNYDTSYIINNYQVDMASESDPLQTILDTGFNNIGLESRNKFGNKDLDVIDLNIDSSPFFANPTSNSLTIAIEVGEGYIKRFKENLLRAEFAIRTSEHDRIRLNDFIAMNLNNSKYDLSSKLFLITGVNIDDDTGLTTITCLESIA